MVVVASKGQINPTEHRFSHAEIFSRNWDLFKIHTLDTQSPRKMYTITNISSGRYNKKKTLKKKTERVSLRVRFFSDLQIFSVQFQIFAKR